MRSNKAYAFFLRKLRVQRARQTNKTIFIIKSKQFHAISVAGFSKKQQKSGIWLRPRRRAEGGVSEEDVLCSKPSIHWKRWTWKGIWWGKHFWRDFSNLCVGPTNTVTRASPCPPGSHSWGLLRASFFFQHQRCHQRFIPAANIIQTTMTTAPQTLTLLLGCMFYPGRLWIVGSCRPQNLWSSFPTHKQLYSGVVLSIEKCLLSTYVW